MKKSIIIIAFLTSCQSMNAYAGYWSRVSANTLRFEGEIGFDEYENYLKIISDEDKIIIVNSEGGFTGAGVNIGLDMVDRNLTVIVRNECLSSCANYIFLAAQKKIIDNGYVGFHGSNIEYQKYDLNKDLEEMRLEGLSETELSNYKNLIREISSKEEIFFKKVGVNKKLFEVSRLDDKGSGNGKSYSFLALSLRAFGDYLIYNVSGIVNINTDPSHLSYVYLKE